MKILVINSGSSSIKFKVFDMDQNTEIAAGLVEEIGTKNARAKLTNKKTDETRTYNDAIENHEFGIEIVNRLLKECGVAENLSELDGIGHRIVQGGALYDKSVIVDEKVMKDIDDLSLLAPLHNPGNLTGIKSVIAQAPNVPNVVVFDTVFHQSMPEFAYRYAIPNEFYEKYGIRKYGFHGTNHKYVCQIAREFLEIAPENFNAISLHIGNGASATAIKGSKCVDTSMGLTPLEGLIMGTRSGDVDPSIFSFLYAKTGMNADEIDKILNKKSGFLGICGTSDARDIEMAMLKGDEKAKLAIDMYVHRIVKYVGAYYALLGRIDALIWTAGIGENSDIVRAAVCKKLEHMGICIDDEKNAERSKKNRIISTDESPVKILVIPANEELAIAIDTKRLISK